MSDAQTHSAWQCPACGHKGNTTARKCSACSWLKPITDRDDIPTYGLPGLIESAEQLRDEVGNWMVKTVIAKGEHSTDPLAEALADIAMGNRRNWDLESARALEAELGACSDTVETFLSNRDL